MTSIIEAQARLLSLGFDPKGVDGVAGRNTQAAVRAFQKAKGLPETALLDARTLAVLFAADGKAIAPAPAAVPLPWMAELKRRKGLHETRDKAALWQWLKSDRHSLGDPSKLPWCGDCVETAIALTLPDEPIPNNPYWAQNWSNFGTACLPRFGAVLVFVRPGGGHVGFYVGEAGAHFKVAGGNQSNAITFDALIAKSRLVASRWPKTFPITGPGRVSVSGGKISTNEA